MMQFEGLQAVLICDMFAKVKHALTQILGAKLSHMQGCEKMLHTRMSLLCVICFLIKDRGIICVILG